MGRRLILSRLKLYTDAFRAVRFRQAVGRARRLVPPRLLMAGAAPARVTEFHAIAGGLLAEATSQSAPSRAAHEAQAFTAVGATRAFSPSRAFWSDRSDGLLFLFHLHGFAELPTALDGQALSSALPFWSRVITSWLDLFERPELPAWHPYPTSVRVIAWSVALSTGAWDDVVRWRVVESLWRQAHYLRRSVEHDIGGNHVLKNATALAFAGACFPDSRLLDRALRLLERELPRQFLADGCHEERSTSYHRETLHDLRQVAELLRRSEGATPAVLRETIDRAEFWSEEIVGPDLKLPLLNDAWEGPPLTRRAVQDVTVLPASGHVVLRDGSNQAVFDCGPLAPRHLPPHAHADALAVVAWFEGEQLLVDRGTFAYSGPRRDHFRATAAHNTVEIEHQSQCVFWGDFRASRLPVVELGTVVRAQGAVLVSASHDGYQHLPGRPIHRRVLVWLPGDGLLIVDRIDSLQAHAVRSFLHLAPSATLVDGLIGGISLAALGPLPTECVAEQHAPWLGTEVVAQALVQEGTIAPLAPFGWSLLRAGAAIRALDTRRVHVLRSDGTELELALPWPSPQVAPAFRSSV
jgi:Heparinase II/III-like protein/Heparinase II/III N-terminus